MNILQKYLGETKQEYKKELTMRIIKKRQKYKTDIENMTGDELYREFKRLPLVKMDNKKKKKMMDILIDEIEKR